MNKSKIKNSKNKRVLFIQLIHMTSLLKIKIKDKENKNIGIISEYNVIRFGIK